MRLKMLESISGNLFPQWDIILDLHIKSYLDIFGVNANITEQDIMEIIESQIDGASHFRMLTSIYIPASVPAITTVGLFYAIDRWNGYFWAEIVLQKDKLYPLQVLVKKMLQNTGDSGNLFAGTVSAFALIIIAIVPIMIVFPFIQKYFKKGVMVGSVK